MGGVTIRIIKIQASVGKRPIAREKRRAPKTKSSWSAKGTGDPGCRPSRRLMKESIRSPTNPPSESVNPSNADCWPGNRNCCEKPTKVPTIRPARKPRTVLWAPNIGFPSKNARPASKGSPPPKMTGAALAQ